MTQARWLVQIDWNDDGDFSDANEDVTADVLGMTLEHLRDLSSGHIEAARLELELKNDDHRYSPPNASSPLGGLLRPGRAVRVRAAYPYDALSGEAGSRLGTHVPDQDAGWTWTEHLQGFRIGADGVGAETDGGRAAATAPPRSISATPTPRSDVSSGGAWTQPTTAASASGTRATTATCT